MTRIAFSCSCGSWRVGTATNSSQRSRCYTSRANSISLSRTSSTCSEKQPNGRIRRQRWDILALLAMENGGAPHDADRSCLHWRASGRFQALNAFIRSHSCTGALHQWQSGDAQVFRPAFHYDNGRLVQFDVLKSIISRGAVQVEYRKRRQCALLLRTRRFQLCTQHRFHQKLRRVHFRPCNVASPAGHACRFGRYCAANIRLGAVCSALRPQRFFEPTGRTRISESVHPDTLYSLFSRMTRHWDPLLRSIASELFALG